jgi:hypothetical protein
MTSNNNKDITKREPVANCDQLESVSNIENRILNIRNTQVMMDRDLSELYSVSTKRLNEQVKRNIERFPERFRFQLTEKERNELVTNCDRFKTMKHSSVMPYVFTEQGVAMLSTVLHSKIAVDVSIRIMDAFVAMRKFVLSNAQIFQRLDSLELKQAKTDDKLEQIFSKLEQGEIKTKQGIFYDGQIFDAYCFVSDLIKGAKAKIILIDNYIDETVLSLFSKCNKSIEITIYTKNISQKEKLDISKYNQQYRPINIKEFTKSHDRFLIIDSTVYHFGASLKDLGKKWFAFAKMEIKASEILDRLKDSK